LVVVQPPLSEWVRQPQSESDNVPAHGGPILLAAIFGTGIYGGYFGAAQGVLLLALLGVFVHEDIQRLNAVKNVLALLTNGLSAAIFIVVAEVDWLVVALIAAGAIIGGQLGAKVGRRLPPNVLRAVIVVVGTLAVLRLVFG
ncbi:MAG: sulfite exporter TauE/SafE family protein, partial [Nocardia sp.]|nr:sulfite exporter TauE/SafE family protein [Nocardia sp.]